MPFQALPALSIRNPKIGMNALERQSLENSRTGNALAGRAADRADATLGLNQDRNVLAGRRVGLAEETLGLNQRKFDAGQEKDTQQAALKEMAGIASAFRNMPAAEQETQYPILLKGARDITGGETTLPDVYGDEAKLLIDSFINQVTPPSAPQAALSPAAEAQKIRIAQGSKPAPAAQTDAGKLVSDREFFSTQYGQDSPQVRAFDELAQTEGQSPPKLTDVAGLRKEFTAQSKDFVKIRDAFTKVKALGEQDSAAGDLGMIFNIMKMFDPGSVVRESEFATAENAAGVPDQVRNQWNKLRTGERLTVKQRNDFIQTADTIFKGQSDAQRSLQDAFRGIAERQNFDPANVVIDFGPQPEGAPEPAATDNPFAAMSDEEILDQLRQQGIVQ